MDRVKYASRQKVAAVVKKALTRGAAVEIDGLGLFRKTGKGYSFQPANLPRIFVSYVHEDIRHAERIYEALLDAGFEPWLDRFKLLPGQNWARAMRNALETSDFAICCFSQNSFHKRGGFQSEMRYALECANRLPLEDVFLIPVRLDECTVPVEVARQMHYVDMFPDWENGMERVIEAIHHQLRRLRAA